MGIETGHRVGGFLILVDSEGCRHAVRLAAIQCLSDADPCADTTLMILPGGRQVTIHHRLEDVLGWVQGGMPG